MKQKNKQPMVRTEILRRLISIQKKTKDNDVIDEIQNLIDNI